jgi:hypothetical protein
MFKKTIVLFVVLALSCLLVFSCSKDENPFNPNKGGYNSEEQENVSFIASIDPGDTEEIDDVDPSTSEIEGEIVIYFECFMNENTINTSNIVVRDTTNGTSITGAELTYFPEIKKAVYRGTFSNDAVFIVTLKNALENQAGVFLDGNGNELDDGSPYDDVKYRLYTGTGNVWDYDFVHPEIDWVDPGTTNGVDSLPTITVKFTDSDIDTSKLNLSNFNLMKTSNQVAVSCTLLTAASDRIQFRPKSNLDQTTQYTVTVKCASVKDTCGNVLLGHKDDDPVWIENIPDYTWDFITARTDTLHDGVPPQVIGVNPSGEELIVRFDDDMDISTFTTSNIRVYDGNQQNLVGSIIPDYDERGFHYTLENAISGTQYTLWVSKDVKEQSPGGWNLDGDGDGVGGEELEDDYETTFTAP